MVEYTESDISYLRGRIEGFLQGVARQTAGSKEFDQTRWESLYGTRISRQSDPVMFQLDERDRQLIEEWDQLLLRTIRQVYDTSPSR